MRQIKLWVKRNKTAILDGIIYYGPNVLAGIILHGLLTGELEYTERIVLPASIIFLVVYVLAEAHTGDRCKGDQSHGV